MLSDSGGEVEALRLTELETQTTESEQERLFIRARAWRALGNATESKAAYRAAREHRDAEILRRELAWLCATTGEPEDALSLGATPVEVPLSAGQLNEWWLIRARALRELHHLDEAEDALRHAVSIGGRTPVALEQLAWVALAAGRPSEAITFGRESLDRARDVAERVAAHDVLGVALLSSGHAPEGVREFDAAIALAPRRPWTHFHRAQCLARMERRLEALESVERALELHINDPEADELRRILL